MTEGMMSPERQGWFAGVKDKLRKSFTVEGSKENFYKKNADLISKATANLSPEDKQAAFATIEQDALTSAKIDVATHWGVATLGATAAVFGGGLVFNEKFRTKVGSMRFGRGLENAGKSAKDFINKILHRGGDRVVRTGQFDAFQDKAAGLRKNLADLMRRKKAGGNVDADIARVKQQLDKVGHGMHERGVFANKTNRKELSKIARLGAQKKEYFDLLLKEKILIAGKDMKNVRDPDALKEIQDQLSRLRVSFKMRGIDINATHPKVPPIRAGAPGFRP